MKTVLKNIIGVLSFFLLAVSVEAAGIVLSPPKFEFNVDPGQTIESIVKITNQDSASLFLNSEVKDFVASGETGQPSFVDPTSNTTGLSLASWITVNNGETVEIKAGEKKEIPFTISVPENAEPGGKYGTIFFFPPSSGGQVAVVQKIGSLILVRVSGAIVEDGGLAEFGVYDEDIKGEDIPNSSTDFFFEKTPVPFAIRYENRGNIHVKPTGKIEIFNTFGQQIKPAGVISIVNEQGVELKKEIVDYLPVNDGRGNVLAKSYRTFRADWLGTPFWYKEEDGSKVIKYKGYPIGLYTAKLTLIGAGGTETVETVKFLVFPWKEIFGGGFAAALLIFLFIKYRRWSRKRFEAQIRAQMKAMKE